MGLDMYLLKRTYVKRWDHIPAERQYLVVVTRGGNPVEDISSERISEVVEDVGYWRKANAIHAWFVKNVQEGKDECQESYVKREQLETLLGACKEVLADHSKAGQLLPTQSGFFFGATEYDEYYFQDLEATVKILEAALSCSPEGSFYYEASW